VASLQVQGDNTYERDDAIAGYRCMHKSPADSLDRQKYLTTIPLCFLSWIMTNSIVLSSRRGYGVIRIPAGPFRLTCLPQLLSITRAGMGQQYCASFSRAPLPPDSPRHNADPIDRNTAYMDYATASPHFKVVSG
jgi:hypothetical protein